MLAANAGAYYRPSVEAYAGLPGRDGGILCIGDSLVDLMPDDLWDQVIVNRGVVGFRIDDVITHFPVVFPGVPDTVVVLVGINDIAWGEGLARMQREYASLLDMIKTAAPDANIYVVSVLPTLTRWYVRQAERFNALLVELAGQYGVTYVDAYSVMIDPITGLMRREYTCDGVHLTSMGYLVLIEELQNNLRFRYGGRGSTPPPMALGGRPGKRDF